MKVDLFATVGDVASSFWMYALCGAPFTRALPFTFPFCFSLRNMREDSALVFSILDNLQGSSGINVSTTCSCVSLFLAASTPGCPKRLRPALRLYCVNRYLYTAILSSNWAISSGSCWWLTSSIIPLLAKWLYRRLRYPSLSFTGSRLARCSVATVKSIDVGMALGAKTSFPLSSWLYLGVQDSCDYLCIDGPVTFGCAATYKQCDILAWIAIPTKNVNVGSIGNGRQ